MYQYKWNVWRRQCIKVINEHNNRRNKALAAAFMCQSLYEEHHCEREHWVRPLLQNRKTCGFFYSMYPVLCLFDADFREYFRMSRVQLEALLIMVAPKITKQNAIREAIPPAERLCVTIRFLASGDSMTSMSFLFLLGLPTVINIIAETCEAIWSTLAETVVPRNYSSDDWLRIASEFEQQWDFPHCIGAIDGKHVTMQCPNNAGSEFFNYKNSHSTILLAICDANYNFLYVDVGSYGRRSDGGVFRDSSFGQRFRNEEMYLPPPQPISIGGPPLPYVLVGDEAFQLSNFLMRPYPGKGGLNQKRKIYNYRLSRARRTIENTFGILANRWRILRRPIIGNIDTCEKIILATTCLHNWLRKQDGHVDEYISSDLTNNADRIISESGRLDDDEDNSLDDTQNNNRNRNQNNSSFAPLDIRDEFCRYFSGEGAVSWQFSHC